MNSSFLLTSQKRVERNSYRIPQEIVVTGVRLKSAIIDYTEKNAVNHIMYIDANFGSAPVGTGQTLPIPDGVYTPESYAETLQNILNDASRSVQSEDEITANTYTDTSPMSFEVTFNEATGKLEFVAKVKNSFTRNVFVYFNDEARDYVGVDDPFVWEVNSRGTGRNMRTTPRKVLQLPRYYRICSNQLGSFGYSYDDSMSTNIIGIVPIDYSKKWTSWENSDDFFHMRENTEVKLYSILDVEIFLEESHTPLVDPEFSLVFQIQS